MSEKHLGPVFDIHGGGIDLVFPHHENEIAQSRCAHGTPVMANVWMHNGFLQVEGEKMSKSLGNFITINQLLATDTFGKTPWHGRVVRLAMLGTHYRQPIDWTADRLVQARTTLMDFADLLKDATPAPSPNEDVVAALSDDLNTPSALSIVYGLAKSARRNADAAADLKATLAFMGLLGHETADELNVGKRPDAIDKDKVAALVQARLDARKQKDFKESDRIRDELAAMGIALKDAKDPQPARSSPPGDREVGRTTMKDESYPLRPFMMADTLPLREVFAQSIEELTAEDYTEDQRAAWASFAEDAKAFADRLAKQTTLVVVVDGEYAASAP